MIGTEKNSTLHNLQWLGFI